MRIASAPLACQAPTDDSDYMPPLPPPPWANCFEDPDQPGQPASIQLEQVTRKSFILGSSLRYTGARGVAYLPDAACVLRPADLGDRHSRTSPRCLRHCGGSSVLTTSTHHSSPRPADRPHEHAWCFRCRRRSVLPLHAQSARGDICAPHPHTPLSRATSQSSTSTSRRHLQADVMGLIALELDAGRPPPDWPRRPPWGFCRFIACVIDKYPAAPFANPDAAD